MMRLLAGLAFAVLSAWAVRWWRQGDPALRVRRAIALASYALLIGGLGLRGSPAGSGVAVWLVASGVTLVGAFLLGWLARRVSPEAWLRRIVLGSYAVRVALSVALYLISYLKLPILKALHSSNGFWQFGLDCPVYHYYGQRIAQAWKLGVEFPDPGLSLEYFTVVATVYSLLGAHPLYPVLVNSLLAAANGLVAFALARALRGSPRAALIAAALVSCWPSTLLWPTQLLKDPLSWLLIFASLAAFVKAVDGIGEGRPLRPLRRARACVVLCLLVFGLTRLRVYLGISFLLAAAVTLGPGIVAHLVRRRLIAAGGYALLLASVVSSVLFARTVNPLEMFSPAHPEVGHYNLGMSYLRSGDARHAGEEFRRALDLGPEYAPAHVGLGAALMQLDRLEQATACFRKAISLDPGSRGGYAGLGTVMVQLSKRPAAIEAYKSLTRVAESSDERDVVKTMVRGLEQEEAEIVAAESGLGAGNAGGDPDARVSAMRGSRRAAQWPSAEPAHPPIADKAVETRVEASVRGDLQRAAALDIFNDVVMEGSRPAPTPAPQDLAWVTKGLERLDEQALASAQEMRPEVLGSLRKGFVSTGGYSLMDAWAQVSSPEKLVTYLPRALKVGFFAPFPRQWLDMKGSTGVMRALASPEMALVYLLTLPVIIGACSMARRRPAGGLFILAFIGLLAASMSLVVANLGTLFRLRLQFLLPLLIFAGAPLERLWDWLRRRIARPREAGVAPRAAMQESDPAVAR